MLTLKQFMYRTSKARKLRADYVKLTGVKTGHLRNGLGYVACKSYSTHYQDDAGNWIKKKGPKNRHITLITFINNKLNVHAACSCQDNLYRWEYANTSKGAAVIEYSNGQPPTITNPQLKASLCKHMVALVERIRPKLPPGYL